MNKYASGYALIRLMSVVGSVFIAVSIIGGVVIGVSSPRGMGGYGFVVAILGVFQGLMILGVGAIGEAILDGARSQASSVELLEQLLKDKRTNNIGGDGNNKVNPDVVKPIARISENIRKEMSDELARSDDRLR